MSRNVDNHEKSGKVPISKMARETYNPVREIVDTMDLTPHPDKPMIPLSMGDPTVFGNLQVSELAEEAVFSAVRQRTFNGYSPSEGHEVARQAVANYVSTPTSKVFAKDIFLTSGCTGAINLCIGCLAQAGQNILVPCPGFPLYRTLAQSHGIESKSYNLLPEKSWEIDLAHLESLVDAHTMCIVVCNPSNPCGSVFSREHILDILAVAHRNRLPVIVDEIYEHFVFEGVTYQSMASLSENVPILACGGLTKRFLVPGWRMGWVVINDRNEAFTEVRIGLRKLSRLLLGPSTIIQSAMVDMLSKTPESFYKHTRDYVQTNAEVFYRELSKVPGLKPVMPQGSMYMMVGVDIRHFPEFVNDVDFAEKMVGEQSVFCIPATFFGLPKYLRLVLTVPKDKVAEACVRMREFCRDHYATVEDDANP